MFVKFFGIYVDDDPKYYQLLETICRRSVLLFSFKIFKANLNGVILRRLMKYRGSVLKDMELLQEKF